MKGGMEGQPHEKNRSERGSQEDDSEEQHLGPITRLIPQGKSEVKTVWDRTVVVLVGSKEEH